MILYGVAREPFPHRKVLEWAVPRIRVDRDMRITGVCGTGLLG